MVAKVTAWENERGTDFIYDGVRISDSNQLSFNLMTLLSIRSCCFK